MIRFMISNGRTQGASGGGRWAMIFGVALAAAFGIVLMAVGVGLALLLAPVVIVAGLIARARLRRMLREMGLGQTGADAPRGPFQRRPADADVIEGEYRVVEEPSRSRQRDP